MITWFKVRFKLIDCEGAPQDGRGGQFVLLLFFCFFERHVASSYKEIFLLLHVRKV